MLNLDFTTLQAVTEKALIDAAAHPRWIAAINRARSELDTNPWIARGELHGLIIASPSGNLYSANGVCQCCAYTGIDPKTGKQLHAGKKPCWHRACARIVRLYDERLAVATQLAEQVITVVDQSRVARKIAATRATALLNECFV